MKTKKLKRYIVILLSALMLFAQLFGLDFSAFAAGSRSNPPVGYPDNCVKTLNADMEFAGDFKGSNCLHTKTSVKTANITKYESLDFDLFFESSNQESSLRVYVFDSTYKGEYTGRRFYDITVKPGEWHHITIYSSSWQDYGMAGDLTDVQGYMIESNSTNDTAIKVTNVCLVSSDIVSPDELPEKVISKPMGTINVTTEEETYPGLLASKFKSTDFTYGDNIEFDCYFGSKDASENVSAVLGDSAGRKAVYALSGKTNEWLHKSLKLDDFVKDTDFDATDVVSLSLEDFKIGIKYYFDNLCITGIATPKDYPENAAVKLYKKYDYDKKGTGGISSVVNYGSVTDFSQHDFFEFDIYIESANKTERVIFFLIDSSYDFSSSSTPANAKRLQNNYQNLETNKWLHIKMPVANIGEDGTGKGDIKKIAGFHFNGLNKNNRYIICNQCITDLTAPEAVYSYGVIESTDKSLVYRQGSETTEKLELDTALDKSNATYFEFDAVVISKSESLKLDLTVEDENGKTASTECEFVSNSWNHKCVQLSKFKFPQDFGNIKAVYFKNASNAQSTMIYNLALTAVTEPELNTVYKLDEHITAAVNDWYVSGDQNAVTYFNEEHTPINLKEREFIELDLCFETDRPNKHAEYVCAGEEMVMPMPQNLSFEDAASLPEAYATSYLNLFIEGHLTEGKTAYIPAGASGLASAAIPLAKAFGARVITSVREDSIKEKIAPLNADVILNSETDDLPAFFENEERNNRAPFVVMDCLSGKSLGECMPFMARGGYWVVISTLAGTETNVLLRPLLTKGLHLVGSMLRNRTVEQKGEILKLLVKNVWQKIENGSLKPCVYKVLPIEKAREAHRILEQNENVGKVVLRVADEEK